MTTYESKYGKLYGIRECELHGNGIIKECSLDKKSELNTAYGILIPQFDFSNPRKKPNYCISFYESGALRKVSLDKKTDICTQIGVISAELLTFYESGSIKRLFPLNGHLSAYWEENDEYQLAEEMLFECSFGRFSAKVIVISFYEDGKVKDITFWPNERINLITPVGECRVRIGLSLYPDGSLKSIEPSSPIQVKTPIGTISAFDITANGISGEINSLSFTPDGSVKSFLTSTQQIIVKVKDNKERIIGPVQTQDVDGLEIAFRPLSVELTENSMILNKEEFNYNEYSFTIVPYHKKGKNQCTDCANCSGCDVSFA